MAVGGLGGRLAASFDMAVGGLGGRLAGGIGQDAGGQVTIQVCVPRRWSLACVCTWKLPRAET